MKLSETTVSILKNFSAINPNIIFKEGNAISTISEAKNIMASATIPESIPREFGIYDLNEFLSTISLIDDPMLEFGQQSINISDGTSNIEYFYSSPELLTTPSKSVNMPKADVTVALSADLINKIKKAAAVLGHPTLQFSGNNGVISAKIVDLKNPTANKYSVVMDAKNACKEVFSFVTVIGNLKMLSGDYTVSLSSKLISHFKNNSAPVEYWIALEKNSTFAS